MKIEKMLNKMCRYLCLEMIKTPRSIITFRIQTFPFDDKISLLE